MSSPASESSRNGTLIRLRGLGKDYDSPSGPIPVLTDVDLTIKRGETVAIVGPSGCGKSTLLFILGLFLPPTRGTYLVEGTDVLALGRGKQAAFRRKTAGFVFQSCNLIENSTVHDNLEFPLIYAGVPHAERAARIRVALDRVNLAHRAAHPTNKLSGGEQQRVAIARALVNEPRIILADEPTGQLDRKNGELVMEHFEGIVREAHTALIVVTHDSGVAARCHSEYHLVDGRINRTR